MVEWSDLFDGHRIARDLRVKFEDGSVLAICPKPHVFPVEDSSFPFEAYVIEATLYPDALGDTGKAQEDFEIAPELQCTLADRQINSFGILVERDGFRTLEDRKTILDPVFIIDIGLELDTDEGPIELITYSPGLLDTWIGVRALTVSSTGQSEALLPRPVN